MSRYNLKNISHNVLRIYDVLALNEADLRVFCASKKHDKDKCPRRRNDRRSVDLFAVSGCATPPASNIQAGNSGCFGGCFTTKYLEAASLQMVLQLNFLIQFLNLIHSSSRPAPPKGGTGCV